MSGDRQPGRLPVAVDPPGCGCTECLTGLYFPLQMASRADIARLVAGVVRNNTGLRFGLTPGAERGTVTVSAFFQDGAAVAHSAPREPAWDLVRRGWTLELALLAHAFAQPADAAADRPPDAPPDDAFTPDAGARAGETPGGGCACAGRTEGRHDLLCEAILRSAFGQVGDAPADVQALLRDRGRLLTGTIVSPDETSPQERASFPAAPNPAAPPPGRPARSAIPPAQRPAGRRRGGTNGTALAIGPAG